MTYRPSKQMAGWTDGRFLVGAGAGADPTEIEGKVFNAITPVYLWYLETRVSSTPRTATVSSVLGDVITLTANEAYRFWNVNMNGNCYVKIANTSKAPVEYAWVESRPAVNTLQVTVAADISGWVNTDVISTAQDGAADLYVELDISPSVPAGATGVFLRLSSLDSGVVANYHGVHVKRDAAAIVAGGVYTQVTDIANEGTIFCGITTARHIMVRDRACGADTLFPSITAVAYII